MIIIIIVIISVKKLINTIQYNNYMLVVRMRKWFWRNLGVELISVEQYCYNINLITII